ncbi:MAG: class I SAM-dependent RNA methyltransferase, partial [Acidobacteria bacterium]|nr:class I SAM-dependent RNA methyltransferase [Acidobacteriota bacterium]
MAENEVASQTAGETLNISIEKMVYGGEGLARTLEGVLLVPLVLPGESATVQLEERHKGIRRGRLLQVAEPSPDRISAECPYFSRCGGCHYQHIRYERQLQLKQEILSECFERIGKIRLEVPISVLASEPWHYRNRTRFRVEKESSRFEIGYYEMLSHRLCPVESCPVSSPAINEALRKLCEGAVAAYFPDGKAEMELFASDSDRALLATIYSRAAAPQGFGETLQNALPGLESVCWWQEPSAGQRPKVTTWGDGSLAYHVGDFHYRVSPGSFFQTNRFLLESFIRAVVGDLEGNRALDLYAGVGFFTVPLARRFEKVTAVEADPASAKDLASNVAVVSAHARS